MSNQTSNPSPTLLVADADWLTPDLAVGGDLSADPVEAAAQARWLQRQGITDIIDCRGEYSDERLVADACPGMRYHHLPTDDHGGELDADWWAEGIDIARHIERRDGSVFVHCHMGVNRGPSLALGILFDRGMDPIAAFDLLRARRPQAFGIYAPQFLRLGGRREDATVLEAFMDLECPQEDLVAAIGRIRAAESGGRFRFPLQNWEPGSSPDASMGSDHARCDGGPSCATFDELADLMEESKGFASTEWPLDWVRSLAREADVRRRTYQVELPPGLCMTELYHLLDEFERTKNRSPIDPRA